MASSDDLVKIVGKLTEDNWPIWHVKLSDFLSLKACLDAITVEDHVSNTKALAYVRLSVGDKLFPLIADCTSAVTAWDTLKAQFEQQTSSRRLQLSRELSNFVMVPGESISDYFMRLQQLTKQLAAAGIAASSSSIAIAALAGLPSEYDTLVRILEHSGEVNLAALQSSLRTEEQRISKDVPATASNKVKALAVNHRTSSYRPKSPPKPSRQSPSRLDPQCMWCGQHGHWATNCRQRHSDMQVALRQSHNTSPQVYWTADDEIALNATTTHQDATAHSVTVASSVAKHPSLRRSGSPVRPEVIHRPTHTHHQTPACHKSVSSPAAQPVAPVARRPAAPTPPFPSSPVSVRNVQIITAAEKESDADFNAKTAEAIRRSLLPAEPTSPIAAKSAPSVLVVSNQPKYNSKADRNLAAKARKAIRLQAAATKNAADYAAMTEAQEKNTHEISAALGTQATIIATPAKSAELIVDTANWPLPTTSTPTSAAASKKTYSQAVKSCPDRVVTPSCLDVTKPAPESIADTTAAPDDTGYNTDDSDRHYVVL